MYHTSPWHVGNAISTVKSTDKVKLLTVRSTAFPPAAKGSAATAVVEEAPKVDTKGSQRGACMCASHFHTHHATPHDLFARSSNDPLREGGSRKVRPSGIGQCQGGCGGWTRHEEWGEFQVVV